LTTAATRLATLRCALLHAEAFRHVEQVAAVHAEHAGGGGPSRSGIARSDASSPARGAGFVSEPSIPSAPMSVDVITMGSPSAQRADARSTAR
jgi:hypothetical protein